VLLKSRPFLPHTQSTMRTLVLLAGIAAVHALASPNAVTLVSADSLKDFVNGFCPGTARKLTQEAMLAGDVQYTCSGSKLDHLAWNCGHHCVGDGVIKTKHLCEQSGCHWTFDEMEADTEDVCHCTEISTCLSVAGAIWNRRCEYNRVEGGKEQDEHMFSRHESHSARHAVGMDHHCREGSWLPGWYESKQGNYTIEGPKTLFECWVRAKETYPSYSRRFLTYDAHNQHCIISKDNDRVRFTHKEWVPKDAAHPQYWYCEMIDGQPANVLEFENAVWADFDWENPGANTRV